MSSPITIIDYDIYSGDAVAKVEGETDMYTTAYDFHDGWWCSCFDFKYRRRVCKHCRAFNDVLTGEGIVTTENVNGKDSWTVL